jgi:hypothetical protein
MRERERGCLGGCGLFLAGVVAGVSLTVLALVAWALIRPVDLSPLTNRIAPGGTDLEVTLSEAFLNQEVDEELAQGDLANLARIILDVHPDRRLKATLEGQFDLGGGLAATPKVDTELVLGVENGRLEVHIERIGVGPVQLAREALPELVQPLFESAEETINSAMNERLQAEGFAVGEVRSDEDCLILGLMRE